MFQKGSFSIPSDTSGIFLVKIIQTRNCSVRKHAKISRFLKIVVRVTKPELLKKKKKKMRAIVIRSMHHNLRSDGLSFFFFDNALVLLKKRMNTFAKEIVGSTSKELRIKKFKIAFKKIF